MSKIFYYELKRMLLSKLFIGMLIVNGVFAWYVLKTDIIAGIAYTAPFSVWSYCAYLGKVMPIAIIAVLLLLSGYYGKKQKQVEILTMAVPVTQTEQMMIRTAVMGSCFAIICIMLAIIAMIFYIRFFGFGGFGSFILPAFFIILPCFVFSVGIGQLFGRFHQSLIYFLMLIVFVAGFYGVQNTFDFFCAGYFSAYPLTLPVSNNGEPEFAIDIKFGVSRLIYLASGFICITFNAMLLKHKPSKA